MKIYHWAAGFVLLIGVVFQTALAEETAVVTQKNVNVRGGPSLYSEVITHLKEGDKVTVLEEIDPQKPKPGDPDKWARIKLPEDTHVWVFAPYVKDNVVAVKKINLRGGPGENFSVLGRLQKGDAIKPLRTLQDWIEIEAPADASAYVAFEVLKKTDTAAIEAAKTTAPPVLATETKPSPAPPERKALAAKTVADDAAPTPPARVKEPVAPKAQPAPIPAAVVPELKPKEVAEIPAPAKPAEEVFVKRVVRREGIVRSALSIQAPTPFELVNPETRKAMDYLHAEKSGLTVKHFKGQRVVVTGEEGIDPRWPNTPVLEIETIDSAP